MVRLPRMTTLANPAQILYERLSTRVVRRDRVGYAEAGRRSSCYSYPPLVQVSAKDHSRSALPVGRCFTEVADSTKGRERHLLSLLPPPQYRSSEARRFRGFAYRIGILGWFWLMVVFSAICSCLVHFQHSGFCPSQLVRLQLCPVLPRHAVARLVSNDDQHRSL